MPGQTQNKIVPLHETKLLGYATCKEAKSDLKQLGGAYYNKTS